MRWADEELGDDCEEVAGKKRTRRSRRRRTRGRGKKGYNVAEDADVEEDDALDMEDIHEDETAPEAPREQSPTNKQAMCTSQLLLPNMMQAVTPITPSGGPSTGVLTPRLPGSILSMEGFASPVASACAPGVIVCTSPNAGDTPRVLDASARTPQSRGTPFGISSVTRVMSATPTAFGSLSYQGGHAEYQGSHLMATSPGGLWMGSLCHNAAAIQAPAFFGSSCVTPAPAVYPSIDPMRSWLAGGSATCDTELAMRLRAAAPQTYED